jgi:hypothetical protein
MTSTERARLLEKFNCNPPASATAIAEMEQQFGCRLPVDYAEFLSQCNGGEGFVGSNAYLILWRVEELLPHNAAYEVNEYAPGLLVFGSDGGGEALAFDTAAQGFPVVTVPFVGMERTLARTVALSFDGFLVAMHES